MTLSFSTTWPDRMGYLAGQPNYFVQKIWNSLLSNLGDQLDNVLYQEIHRNTFGDYWVPKTELAPKFHTIREDKRNRWTPGSKIHPVINNRTKDRFQFAPTIECKSVQEIEIHSHQEIEIQSHQGTVKTLCSYVKVDGKQITCEKLVELALNDGFPTIEDFFAYFNTDFTGKLIHWTDLRY